jgi:GNAT superfamily N-acetyltransferase
MQIQQQIEKRSFAIKFTINEDLKVAGRVRLYIIYNELHDEPFGLMEDLFVEEMFRSKGIGRKLVDAVIVEAKKQKCYKLVLTSRYGKEMVHKWYKKMGFKEHGLGFRMDF